MSWRKTLRARCLLPLTVASCLLLPLVVAAIPRPGQPVAVVAWSVQGGGAAAIAARAEGELRSVTNGNRVAITSSNAPDFVTRLYRAGALLVVDASLATACLTPFTSL
jgi:ABC-type nitrate/sulfonate/bicarbonate transport system substrate-binding protein